MAVMLIITPTLAIPDEEFSWTYARAGGPGGQNVNKVSSKAILRWNVATSPSIPPEVRARFRAAEGGRITTTGDVLITSQRYRDQERNRQDCLEKLAALLLAATIVPRRRKRTKPTKGSVEARLRDKKQRSGAKASRRRMGED
jgi:ribosome-associated protein